MFAASTHSKAPEGWDSDPDVPHSAPSASTSGAPAGDSFNRIKRTHLDFASHPDQWPLWVELVVGFGCCDHGAREMPAGTVTVTGAPCSGAGGPQHRTAPSHRALSCPADIHTVKILLTEARA